MKAVLLAGGFGTRLRPLTLDTPKPIVPIFDRPFLYYQIDLLRSFAEVDEVILSLNYQPDAIEAVVGDGRETGLRIRYVVEPTPLGTGGAVKFSERYLDGTVVVLNGDVLTGIDLGAVIDLHRSRHARATIVLTAVDNPSDYGLVETDSNGNVRRFLEKPDPNEVTCDTINAGVYVLEPDTFDLIPPNTKYSIERRYFPSLIDRQETFVAYIDDSYWLDIGTSQKYIQAHRDIMDGRCSAAPFTGLLAGSSIIDPTAVVEASARLAEPCYIGPGARVGIGANIGAHSVVSASSIVGDYATVDGSILWPDCRVGADAVVSNSVIGRRSRVEANAVVGPDSVLGDDSVVTNYSKV